MSLESSRWRIERIARKLMRGARTALADRCRKGLDEYRQAGRLPDDKQVRRKVVSATELLKALEPKADEETAKMMAKRQQANAAKVAKASD